jgi:DNA processing protein
MTPTRPRTRRQPKERRVPPAFAVDGIRPEDVLGELNDAERKNAPAQLFLAGDQSLLRRRPKVSVVGSRQASLEALKRAARISRILVHNEVVVVSGLALGVDAAAHRAAIGAGGKTIAVIGTPLDKSYPKENAALQAEIAANHLVVSQFPSGHKVRRWSFPERNRTMALIVDASVIVEAGDSSGTLSQGWEALRLNRPLFIMKSIMTEHPELKWTHDMIGYGAMILEHPEDLLDVLPGDVDLAALSA